MAKYLLLKHYRRSARPQNVVDIPMAEWSPEEIDAHLTYMNDFAAKLERSGEFVDGQALSPEGTFVRYDGPGRPPVTDGPFAETKEALGGFYVVDARDLDEALEFGAACPGVKHGATIEVRPVIDFSGAGAAEAAGAVSA